LITEEIIVKFFEGKCDARDAAMVLAWLNANPAKLKEYLGEEEWENFQPAHVLSPEISGKLWNNINKNTTSPAVPHSYFRWTAVAASVLLVAGLSWLVMSKKQTTSTISAATVITKNIINTTPQKKSAYAQRWFYSRVVAWQLNFLSRELYLPEKNCNIKWRSKF